MQPFPPRPPFTAITALSTNLYNEFTSLPETSSVLKNRQKMRLCNALNLVGGVHNRILKWTNVRQKILGYYPEQCGAKHMLLFYTSMDLWRQKCVADADSLLILTTRHLQIICSIFAVCLVSISSSQSSNLWTCSPITLR